MRPGQAAPPLHPDGRGFVCRTVRALCRGTGHRTGHGRGAEQTPRPPVGYRLQDEDASAIFNLQKLCYVPAEASTLRSRLTESSAVLSATNGAVSKLAIPIGSPELSCRRTNIVTVSRRDA